MGPLATKLLILIIIALALVPLMLDSGLSEPWGGDARVRCGDNPECNYNLNVGFLIYLIGGIFIGVTALAIKTIKNPPNLKLGASRYERNAQITTIFKFLIAAGLWWGIAIVLWLGKFGFLTEDWHVVAGLLGVCALLVVLLIVYRIIVGKDFEE